MTFNLKYGSRPAADVLEELGMHVVPRFPARLPARAAEASAGLSGRDEMGAGVVSVPARVAEGR